MDFMKKNMVQDSEFTVSTSRLHVIRPKVQEARHKPLNSECPIKLRRLELEILSLGACGLYLK
jgi:hypothetical protein